MEIASTVTTAFATGITVLMLVISLVAFTSLFSLLVGVIADWIMGVTS